MSERKPEYDVVQLEREYSTLRPLLTQLEQEIDHQLAKLLHRSLSLAFPVQHRVKSWASIAEKLQRVPLSLNCVRDLQDLVGFRIVLQFGRDVELVCNLIEKTFNVVDRYDTIKRLKEDQFGYSSVHFVVELPPAWLAVPTMTGLANLRVEIQVRTTAQHIWAEASHTLQYKSEQAVPPELKRAIYRVSALLETVDLEFERVLAGRDSYRAEAAQAPTSANEVLNVETLQQILDSSWPVANKQLDQEEYADLLTDLHAFGVKNSDALRRLIAKQHDAALADDARRVALMRKNPKAGLKPDPKRLDAGVFFTHAGLTRVALSIEFPDLWNELKLNILAPTKVPPKMIVK